MAKELPFTFAQAAAWRSTWPTPFYVYDEAGITKCVNDL